MRHTKLLVLIFGLTLVGYVGAKIAGKSIGDVLREWFVSESPKLTKNEVRELEDSAVRAFVAARVTTMNEDLPMLVNEELRFDEVEYEVIHGDEIALIYKYTLLRAHADELDPVIFREIWLKNFARPGCDYDEVRTMFRYVAEVKYSFRDKDGVLLQPYTLTEDLCRGLSGS